MRDNGAYKTRYGAWAGFPSGNPPDFERCCEEVYSGGRSMRHYQCSKKRGYGPGEAYCATHNPDAVRRRAAERDAKYNAQYNRDLARTYGGTFLAALRQIADGHNDARGLAIGTINQFEAAKRK